MPASLPLLWIRPTPNVVIRKLENDIIIEAVGAIRV